MAIRPGTRLGPYEILSAIGAGGMGEVYKARDTRLDRTVAIKVLLAHMADRTGVRERFEREARTIASLSHPHICVLHDIGHQDGIDYLVMEYLEGVTLAHRLLKGPLPLEDTLKYAAEIADALDKAHSKNITHRDLKPGNIMLTKSGTKLLDFGLAKLKQEAAPPAVPMSQLPTLSNLPTAHSGIVGTLQYMAPEQLEGKTLDGRTDIFAFGAVLYEMATGRKAFEGASQASLISAIISAVPAPISTVQPMTPVALDRVVKKCLAKEPEKRWQTASDLSDALRWIAQDSSERPASSAREASLAATKQRSWMPVLGLAAAMLAVFSILEFWIRRPAPSPPAQVSRFSINLAPGERLAATDFAQPALAISPDGRHIVYAASRNGGLIQLYMRGIDNLDAKPIPGTETASNPFFSPDGQWIGFFAGSMLKKISVSGGKPVDVAPVSTVSQPTGVTWGSDGTIVFGSQFNPALQEVAADGGVPKDIAAPDFKSGETWYGWPSILPNAKALIYSISSGTGSNVTDRIAVRPIAGGEARILIPSGERPTYAASGHLIYNQSSTLMAVPFDIDRLEVIGAPVAVVNGVWRCNVCNGGAQYSFSDNGTPAYIPGTDASVESIMVWVDRDGKETPLAAPARSYAVPWISPDGRTIAAGAGDGVWTYDAERGTLTRLNPDASNPSAWTADSKQVAFQMSPDANVNLFWQAADGGKPAERLASGEDRQAADSFSRDGQFLAFNDQSPVTGADIWIMRISDRSVQPFIQAPSDQGGAKFSPDGHWLAYTSDESGRREIYVQPFPGPGGKHQISTDGGVEPTWNPNGREIFYRNGDAMLAVQINGQSAFSAGKPHILWSAPYRRAGGHLPNYDVAPDGRFLMLKSAVQPATQINLVLNWFEELKQKVPAATK